MSDLDDILWTIQRQAGTLQEVLADARLVWRDANARAAEQRFLHPRAEAESAALAAVAAQHSALNAAAAEVTRAEEHRRTAGIESAQASQQGEQARQSAQAAFSEASAANGQAQQADALAAQAHSLIAAAASAGG